MDNQKANKLLPGYSCVRVTRIDVSGDIHRNFPPGDSDVGTTFRTIAIESSRRGDALVIVTVPGSPQVLELFSHEIEESV